LLQTAKGSDSGAQLLRGLLIAPGFRGLEGDAVAGKRYEAINQMENAEQFRTLHVPGS
jgi:hypothetical protein